MKAQRDIRRIGIILVMVLIGLGVWFTLGDWWLQQIVVERPNSMSAKNESSHPVVGQDSTDSGSSRSDISTAPFIVLPEAERQSGWSNPVQPKLWHAVDWTFDEAHIESNSISRPATFRQPFRKLAIGLRAATRSRDEPAESHTRSPQFELRLRSLDAVDTVVMRVAAGRFWVIDRELDRERELRGNELSDVTDSLYLRVTLTGDRLLVAVNEQLVANVDWPARLLSEEVLIEFAALETPLFLSELRINGE